MAMTPYNGDPEVISKLGTTPQERGLTPEQFKAKFDEGLKAFVTWFNDTHKTEFDAHLAENAKFVADYEYQSTTVVGTQIRVSKQSDTAILKFRLDTGLGGGAIAISTDGGATEKPLLDIEGEPVIELEKGFVEVVENSINFTYVPKGGAIDVVELTSEFNAHLAETAADGAHGLDGSISKFKAGSAVFSDNDTSQTFADSFCTANSLVIVSITSVTPPQGAWSVESANGSFTITSAAAESADITFDYYIMKVV